MDPPQQPPNQFLNIMGLPAEVVNKLRNGDTLKKQDLYCTLVINGKEPQWGLRKVALEAQLANLLLEKPLPPLGQAAVPDEPQQEPQHEPQQEPQQEPQHELQQEQDVQHGPAVLQPEEPMEVDPHPMEPPREDPPFDGGMQSDPDSSNLVDFTCIICMDRRIEYGYRLCGHIGICTTCKVRLHQQAVFRCPVCRRPHREKHVIKVYLANQ